MYRAISLLLSATVLCLAAAAVSPEIDHLDPKCPPSTLPGFEVNTFQYNVPAAGFFNKTGSFFHSEWYTGSVSSTQGPDNTPGSTRSATLDGTAFTERLVSYSRSPTELVLGFTLFTPAPITFHGVTFTSYTEEFRFKSICEGKATHVSMTVVYCTDRVGQAYDLYDWFRRTRIGGVADVLGADVFLGTCPIGRARSR
ncbi:hypothetical protein FPV67DRAFT_1531651 [Lyophyllum atratum]|nr:hypothetical protein FPV67DRAFT_1531651 [Lyophyllum atratum]